MRSGAKTLGGHRSNLGLADLLSDVACSSTTARLGQTKAPVLDVVVICASAADRARFLSARCKLKSFLANVCNYGRVALQVYLVCPCGRLGKKRCCWQTVYQVVNVVVRSAHVGCASFLHEVVASGAHNGHVQHVVQQERLVPFCLAPAVLITLLCGCLHILTATPPSQSVNLRLVA